MIRGKNFLIDRGSERVNVINCFKNKSFVIVMSECNTSELKFVMNRHFSSRVGINASS